MIFRRALLLIVVAFGIAGCASSTKTLTQIEDHFKALERGETPDLDAIERLCRKGATAACAIRGEPAGLARTLAVIQGYTDTKVTMVGVVAPSNASLLYAVIAIGRKGDSAQKVFRVLRAQQSFRRDFSQWRVDHVRVDGLSPEVIYELWVIGQDGLLWDRREFRALDLNKSSPKIIAASCMDDGYRQEELMAWEKVRSRAPDALFLIGDNVYADKYLGLEAKGADPRTLWNRNVESRNLVSLFRWPKLVPVFAVWDDHDFGINDGDRTFPYKEESRAIFETFFPRPDKTEAFERGPGVSSRLSAFGQDFIFFDDRTFRSPNRQELPDQTHFGPGQEQWALSAVEGAGRPVWLISGDQFFGGYHSFESYEGNHATSFAAFKKKLAKLKAPFVFLSGDRHLIELMKIPKKELGFDTYELTTSAIHARTFSQNMDLNPNSRRINGAAGPHNFMELEPKAVGGTLHLKLKGWGLEEGILFERNLVIKRRSN
jgi:hypothetical protein